MSTDDHILNELDQRAATAVTDLDAAVQTLPLPEFRHRRSPQRSGVLLAAAAVIVVAMAAGAILLSRHGDREATLTDRPLVTRPSLPDPAAGGEAPAAKVVGRTSFDDGDVQIDATILAEPDGGYTVEITDGSGSSRIGHDLSIPGVDSPVAFVDDLGNGRTMVAGLIGPGVDQDADQRFSLRSATGAVVDRSAMANWSTTRLSSRNNGQKTDLTLVLIVLPTELLETGLTLVATAPDGTEITLDLPRQSD